MQKTDHYNLCQWEASDSIRREDFNESNRAIDVALKAVADTAAGKASAESVAAVEQSMASKANATDVNALSQTVSALSETVNARKIAVGSYTGNSGTQTISVGFAPKVVYIFCMATSANSGNRSAMAIQGVPYVSRDVNALALTSGGFTVIHNDNATVNYSIYSYCYLALA